MRELRRHLGLLIIQQPVKERYLALDVLRGVALFGVLIINLEGDFRVSLWQYIFESHEFLRRFIEFKAIDLFSICFGISAALQAGRAASPVTLMARRFLVLAAFGLVHLVFIWNGDILTLYALCGLLLIPFLRLHWIPLTVAAMAVLAVSFYVPFHFPPEAVLRAEAVDATRIYATGGYGQIFSFRWDETRRFIAPLLLATLPKVFGLMLTGVALFRGGLFSWPRRVFVVTATIGIFLGLGLNQEIPLALGYGSLIMLFPLSLLGAAGQMALTNYLVQSMVFSFIFYGYGLGLMGTLSTALVAAFGVSFYVLQILLSRVWLTRFEYGPFEWLWRSLTYGRRLPLRKKRYLAHAK